MDDFMLRFSRSTSTNPYALLQRKTMTSGFRHQYASGFVIPFPNASKSSCSFTGELLTKKRQSCSYPGYQYGEQSVSRISLLRSTPMVRLSDRAGNKKRARPIQQSKNEAQRLQKVLAQMGFASRRGAEKLIESGSVRVNNRSVTKSGMLVVPGKDIIHVDGKLAKLQTPVWVAVHKPRGMNSLPSTSRRSVDSEFPSELRKGLIPVAGIEEDASGLLILSNDRKAVAQLNNPDCNLVIEWVVDCYGPVSNSKVIELQRGVVLEGEKDVFRPKNLECQGSARIELSPREKTILTRFVVRVREHRRQLMSRFFSSVGLTVVRMSRRSFGPVLLSPLRRGSFRQLTPNEIKAMIRGVKESTVKKERRHRKIA
ncbi:unnamed protein product [Agarophyton chilense]